MINLKCRFISLQRNKRNPPLCKDQPPCAGAIYWSRLLHNELKFPILRFQKVPELMASPLKDETFNCYLQLAKTLKQYEQAKYDGWLVEWSPVMERTMQMNLLTLTLKRSNINKSE